MAQQSDDMRFSDEMLKEFRDEFKQHVERYEERVKTDDARFEALLKVQEANAQLYSQLIEETRDIVQLHRDFQGVARVGVGLQKFMVWCVKFGFVGVSVAAIVGWVIHYLEKLGGAT